MKRGSTLFLKLVILLIGFITLAGIVWFPPHEGRASGLTPIEIYFHDPYLFYLYIASLPFFAGLYQAFKLLGYIEQNKAFSQISVNALRNIKYCATALSVMIVIAILILVIFIKGEDAAGPIALGIYTTFASIVVATAAGVFQKLLQNAVDIKSENDLTV